MDLIPWADVGIAVIIFTIIVRLILFPLSKSALLTQVRMKDVEADTNKIKAEYAKDRQTQALKIMELYKSKNIKPFSGILLLIIQLPILIGLISVFYKITPSVDPQYLYPFIHIPIISLTLFGMSIAGKSLILSLLTAAAQFFQLHFSIAARQQKKINDARPKNAPAPTDMASQLSGSMTTQMKYFLPLIAFASTYWFIPIKFPEAASIIAIYWSVSALFTLGQELYIRKRHLK
jgi:YidC/Oxa1 family membrane protein insertase